MDLTVKIKKKFKRDLSFRFNPANAKEQKNDYYFSIKRDCPLCEVYEKCANCPFEIFKTKTKKGCVEWVDNVIGKNNFYLWVNVEWVFGNDKQARQQLKELRAKARELITFY